MKRIDHMIDIKKVTAAYFSATGTTKKICERVAEGVASRLGAEAATADFTLPDARLEALRFDEGDLVIFGVPTYAGRAPNVLKPYLTEKVSGGGALAVPVVLYGNRDFDDALIELRNILEDDGFHTIAASGFIGEHSFSYKLAAGRPDEADIRKADGFAEKIAGLIADAGAYEEFVKKAPVEVRGENPIRPYYTPRDRNGESINILKVKPKVADGCSRCGVCADICPMGSIDHTDVRNYTGICIKCGACVKECPKHARYYDDSGYLYHKSELEELYAKRKEPEMF
jgi:ferredoxin/flavodoxin